MVILSLSKIVYIPISAQRTLDIALIPVMFAAMIGGYRIGIPTSLMWGFLAWYNLKDHYPLFWVMTAKLIFGIACTYFYAVFKKTYQRSPFNVYRTVITAVVIKDLTVTIATLNLFPGTDNHRWIYDSLIQLTLDTGLCLMAMVLLIKHLRQIHILNGVRKKGEMQNELSDY